jgi:hypothetical protein
MECSWTLAWPPPMRGEKSNEMKQVAFGYRCPWKNKIKDRPRLVKFILPRTFKRFFLRPCTDGRKTLTVLRTSRIILSPPVHLYLFASVPSVDKSSGSRGDGSPEHRIRTGLFCTSSILLSRDRSLIPYFSHTVRIPHSSLRLINYALRQTHTKGCLFVALQHPQLGSTSGALVRLVTELFEVSKRH